VSEEKSLVSIRREGLLASVAGNLATKCVDASGAVVNNLLYITAGVTLVFEQDDAPPG